MAVSNPPRHRVTIRPYRPGRRIAWALALVATAGVALWQAFEIGRHQASAAVPTVEVAADRPEGDQVEYLLARNGELVEENAVLRQTAEVERIAHEAVRASLLEAQQQVSELSQELEFYRNLMAPGETQSGLHIDAISLSPDLLPNVYRYEVVLTLVRGKDRLASGQLLFKLSGTQDGATVVLNLADMTPDQERSKRYRFKYFQSVSGQLELPADFVPESLELELASSAKGLESITRQYDWQALIAGEVETNVGKD